MHPRVATAVVTLGLVHDRRRQPRQRQATASRVDHADDTGAIEWGPTHPDTVAMFDHVMLLTDADDIVAAPKARAMVWKTGRPSIQIDDYRPIPDDLDIALIVIEQNQDRRLYTTYPGRPTASGRSGRTIASSDECGLTGGSMIIFVSSPQTSP